MKQQQHDINFEEDSEKKKSECQMGFEPTTLRDLVGCSNHLSYWRLYSDAMLLVSSCVPVITWLCSRVMRFQSRPTNWPLLTIESPVSQVF